MFTLHAAFLLAAVSLAVALPEAVPAAPALKVGDIAPKKPNAGSTSSIQHAPMNESVVLNPSRALELRQSIGCCTCWFESRGSGFATGPEIDYGDSDHYTINSWITDPFNTQGCNGHSYTAFNVYGLGYGRWQYGHTDIKFYMDNQYDVPGGARVIQWDKPQVSTSNEFSDFSFNTLLFTAYVIDASNYVVLDSCPCYSRPPESDLWECIPPEACCFAAECREHLDFQCGPCYSLG